MVQTLIDSWATISLMQMSVYNMIEDHYKTSIMPAVITPKDSRQVSHVVNGKGKSSSLDS